MYYKGGKALIGWRTINGKNYCFGSKGGIYANGWKQKEAEMVSGKWLQIDGKTLSDENSKDRTIKLYTNEYS